MPGKKFLKEFGIESDGTNIKYYLSSLEVLSNITDDFMFLLDLKKDEVHFFGKICEVYNLPEDENGIVKTSELTEVIYSTDREALRNSLEEFKNGKNTECDIEYRMVNRNGDALWVSCRGQVVDEHDGIVVGRISEEAMRHLYNPLTSLFNKVKLREDLKKGNFFRTGGYIMLVDVDDLAAINLTHGRKYGDHVLKTLANNLEDIPSAYRIYHVEHNYFAVCVDVKTEQEVHDIYNNIQNSVREMCTITAGAVPLDSNIFNDVDNIYDTVKLTLRRAKKEGAANIAFFSEEEVEQKIYAIDLLEEMKESVQKGFKGFYLNYQPQVKGGNYNLFGAEALIRYESETKGRVFPNDFIPLLEESRLINEVGLWVLETALLQCKKWREYIPDFRISVNFSTVQFGDEAIVEKVFEVLKKTDMPGNSLTIEITESVQLHDVEKITRILKRFKENGIQIAIDDFGTGYSNISHLKQLDIDEIKVDRIFVTGIQEDTYNYKLISNTMEFAKTNELRVCCEGVEDTRELTVLESLSPSLFQGYLFHKPCDEQEFFSNYIDSTTKEYSERADFIRSLYEYKEKMGIIRFDPKDILRATNVGLWIIRISKDGKYFEMHADETMERIMAMEKKYSPEECYRFWYDRIHEDYKEYVEKNVQHMLETDKVVQLQYPWFHPVLGEVIVRCNGRRVEDSDGMTVLDGYHRILSNIDEM